MNKFTKEQFNDIIVFFVSEPGAMGPKDICFYKRNGEHFRFDYRSCDDATYSLMKEYFLVFSQCYFNGPMKSEPVAAGTIVIGIEERYGETRVAPGWKHLYLDYGNHLVIKEEFYQAIKDIFEGLSNDDIMLDWKGLLDKAGFVAKVDEIEKKYWEKEGKIFG